MKRPRYWQNAALGTSRLASAVLHRYSRPAYGLGQGAGLNMDFGRARQAMVDGQLRPAGISETKLLSRFATVPRERFVPDHRESLAYVDDIHWFGRAGASRFMPAPVVLARLLRLAEIGESDTVLDLGATTGYATAVIAGLAAAVTGLETEPDLAARGQRLLSELELSNASMSSGDLAQVASDRFSVIFVQGMLDTVPAAFLDLLKEGGRLVALVRNGPVGLASVMVKTGGHVTARTEFNAFLPPLPGMQREEEFVF